MKKSRFIGALSALCAALLISGTALAARESMANFTPVREYNERFSDVAPDSWYHDNVAYLYELGLTNGASLTKYEPNSPVTLAEAVCFAARVHSLYYHGSFEQLNTGGNFWYMPSVEYAWENNILDDSYESYTEKQYEAGASRLQVAQLLANVLPKSECPEINADTVERGYGSGAYIKDVSKAVRYSDDILFLYKCGVTTGSGPSASFKPFDTISRSELAAMLTRLINPDLRVTLDWQDRANSAVGVTYGDLIYGDTSFTQWHEPTDAKTARSNLEYMFQNNSLTLTLRYGHALGNKGTAMDMLNRFIKTYYDCVNQYFYEQVALGVYGKYSMYSDYTTFELHFGFYTGEDWDDIDPTDRNEQLRAASLKGAIAVHDALWASNRLTGDMSQKEMAKVYFDWLSENCAYSDDSEVSDRCRTPVGVFEDGSAVCMGYTSAYNLLLKLEGIECSTACTDDHIWTVATLDGVSYHIDPTWGDAGSGPDYRYFCMSERDSLGRFE